MNLRVYKDFLSKQQAKKELLESSIVLLTDRLAVQEQALTDHSIALEAINTVGVLVQKELKGVIEELVTQALQYVYGDTHSFEIESKIVRNQPEMYFYLVIDGEKYSPRDEEVSGGQADVVSFALRVILWAMQQERTRPTLVFDEPFKFLGNGPEAHAVGEMLLYLSDMMGLQFIIVTHNTSIVIDGMNRYDVKMNSKKISELSRVEVSAKVL